MKIYGFIMSPPSKALWALNKHLAFGAEEVSVNLMVGEHKQEPYLKINPNGAVPAFTEGDFSLSESWAIMRYFADVKKSEALYPKDPKQRAEINAKIV